MSWTKLLASKTVTPLPATKARHRCGSVDQSKPSDADLNQGMSLVPHPVGQSLAALVVGRAQAIGRAVERPL